MQPTQRESKSEGRNSLRGEGAGEAEPKQPLWVRRLRAALLWLIALLYVTSIPWYRSDAAPTMLFGLPDWVTVAILCYVAAAVLNAVAWLLTDIPESSDDDEARDS